MNAPDQTMGPAARNPLPARGIGPVGAPGPAGLDNLGAFGSGFAEA
jgi:hypothetical protein